MPESGFSLSYMKTTNMETLLKRDRYKTIWENVSAQETA